jgi:hypothetical protein
VELVAAVDVDEARFEDLLVNLFQQDGKSAPTPLDLIKNDVIGLFIVPRLRMQLSERLRLWVPLWNAIIPLGPAMGVKSIKVLLLQRVPRWGVDLPEKYEPLGEGCSFEVDYALGWLESRDVDNSLGCDRGWHSDEIWKTVLVYISRKVLIEVMHRVVKIVRVGLFHDDWLLDISRHSECRKFFIRILAVLFPYEASNYAHRLFPVLVFSFGDVKNQLSFFGHKDCLDFNVCCFQVVSES